MKRGREGMYEKREGRDVSGVGVKGCMKRRMEGMYEEREGRDV